MNSNLSQRHYWQHDPMRWKGWGSSMFGGQGRIRKSYLKLTANVCKDSSAAPCSSGNPSESSLPCNIQLHPQTEEQTLSAKGVAVCLPRAVLIPVRDNVPFSLYTYDLSFMIISDAPFRNYISRSSSKVYYFSYL